MKQIIVVTRQELHLISTYIHGFIAKKHYGGDGYEVANKYITSYNFVRDMKRK